MSTANGTASRRDHTAERRDPRDHVPAAIVGRDREAPRPTPEPADTAVPPLTEADRRQLAEYEKKLQVVRDRVVGVITGRSTGLYLWGPGGGGKSFTVIETLREHERTFRVHNSRMDGRGLFTALQSDPDAVLVLEDCEQLMRNRNVRGLLRSALWGQRDGHGPMERTVTWPLSGGKQPLRCDFTGGLIIVANLPPADLPEMAAVITRIPVIHLAPSDAELRATMRQMARQGYEDGNGTRLAVAECVAVCEFLITECQHLDRSLDLRLLVNSLEDYLQWDAGEAGLDWRDLIRTRVRQRPAGIRGPVAVAAGGGVRSAVAARKEAELVIVRDILVTTLDAERRVQLWHERTGKGRSSFYRRLAELGQPRDA